MKKGPGRRSAKPSKARGKAKPAGPRRDLEQRLAAALRREAEALEQQAATSEILRVISSSPTDVQPVFETIARNASRLCHGMYTLVTRFDGELIHLAALHNPRPDTREPTARLFPRRPGPDTPSARAILDRAVVHIPDGAADHDLSREVTRATGARSFLAVPMLRGGVPVGTIAVSRAEVGPFPPNQIELVKTFADQAVIALENVRLFGELEARNRELTATLEQQTATADVLRVISSSPTDVQPVLDAVAESATRLCEARDVSIALVDGAVLRVVATHGILARWWPDDGVPISRGSVTGRAVVDRHIVHVHDLASESDAEFPEGKAYQRRGGHRTNLAVPLLRKGVPIGAVVMRRGAVRPFTDRQIALLQAFADQAVIAIENVRLFNETKEALERQTATAEILKVISASPTDVQPVFDAVAASAARLCGVDDVTILRVEDGGLRRVAHVGSVPVLSDSRLPLLPGGVNERVLAERRTVHIADTHAPSFADRFPASQHAAMGTRALLATPLVHDGVAIGLIQLRRSEPRPFTDRQITLLETFADQAVIAIQNVRLFRALEVRNRELTEALEQQTATGEILRVISSSPTDVQPVFDAIVESAVRLCEARSGALYRLVDGVVHHVAYVNPDPAAHAAYRAAYPRPLDQLDPRARRHFTEGGTTHIPDTETAAGFGEEFRVRARLTGYRSNVAVPMLRDGEVIGSLSVARAGPDRTPRPFSEQEIRLLETFTAQAVIAIENVRLFTALEVRNRELTDALEQQTATGEILRVISRSPTDVQPVFDAIVTSAVRLCDGLFSTLFRFDGELVHHVAHHNFTPEALEAQHRIFPTRPDRGLGAARAILERAVVHIPDVQLDPEYRAQAVASAVGWRSGLFVPMLREGAPIGAIGVSRVEPGPFSESEINLLKTFADQAVIAIENVRLFHEIQDKSRQLETASRHKSEFLANMSHELRTPLNAIIGFSEVLAERMFGEVNAKQAEYLQDILASARHLLSLITDILDLSKVEAGRLELELGPVHLPTALDNALTLVRERATRHGITLTQAVDAGVGEIVADERKVKQILLNLLSNAVKFTPEGGRVDVSATATEAMVTVAVSDSGIGIALEDQAAIFEEFRQVGRDGARKQEGTGLGLALARKLVELHGGRLWVESQPGQGSTFTFTLPTQPEGRG